MKRLLSPRRNTLRIVLLILSFVAATVFAVLGSLNLVSAFQNTHGAFTADMAGWERYVGQSPSKGVMFANACMQKDECKPQYLALLKHYFDWRLHAGFGGSILLMLLVVVFLKPVRHRPPPPATGRWSTAQDLIKAGYMDNPADKTQSGYLGMHPETGKRIRIPQDKRVAHTLVLGGPGARKSTGYYWQNILSDAQDEWSVIIFDLKWPDPIAGFSGVLPYYQKKGYNVQVFAPFDEHTHRLPLLDGAEDERVAREIAFMLIPPDDSAAKYYRDAERRILIGLIMHAAKYNVSLKRVHDVLLHGPQGVQRFLGGKELTGDKNSDEYGRATEQAQTMVGSLFAGEPREQAGLVSGLEGMLQAFANKSVGQATTRADEPYMNIDLKTLGTEKSILYVGIPQRNVDDGSAGPLLQLLKRRLDAALSNTAYDHGGALPKPVSFYLDEFPSFGRLPNVERNFATMRSRNVAYHITLQTTFQGSSVYGETEFKSFFTSNLQTLVLFLGSIKFDDAIFISRILGTTLGESKSVGASENINTMSSSKGSSQGTQDTARPLITIDEMQTFPGNMAAVVLNGVPHTRAYFPGIWEDGTGNVKNPYRDAFKELDESFNAHEYTHKLIRLSRAAYNREATRQRLRDLSIEQDDRGGHKQHKPLHTPGDYDANTITVSPNPQRNNHDHAAPSKPLNRPAQNQVSQGGGTPSATNATRLINLIARHIITTDAAAADVERDPDHNPPYLIHLPMSALNGRISEEDISQLIEEGLAYRQKNNPEMLTINSEGVSVLEEKHDLHFRKRLPPLSAQEKAAQKEDAEAALAAAVAYMLNEDVDIQLEKNGGTNQIERIQFSVFSTDPSLRSQYQTLWADHNLLKIENDKAIIRSPGIAVLPNNMLEAVERRAAGDQVPVHYQRNYDPSNPANAEAGRGAPYGEPAGLEDISTADDPQVAAPQNATTAAAEDAAEHEPEEATGSAPKERFIMFKDLARGKDLLRLTRDEDLNAVRRWVAKHIKKIPGLELPPLTGNTPASESTGHPAIYHMEALVFNPESIKHLNPPELPEDLRSHARGRSRVRFFNNPTQQQRVIRLPERTFHDSHEWLAWTMNHHSRIYGYPLLERAVPSKELPHPDMHYEVSMLQLPYTTAATLFDEPLPDWAIHAPGTPAAHILLHLPLRDPLKPPVKPPLLNEQPGNPLGEGEEEVTAGVDEENSATPATANAP